MRVSVVALCWIISNQLNAQCAFINQYFGNVIAPTVQGQVSTASTCSYLGESSTVTNMLSATLYSIDINAPGYVTIRDQALNVVSFGSTPHLFTPPVDGTYYMQWNGVGCTVNYGACFTTTITHAGPSAPCVNPITGGITQASVTTSCPTQPFNLSISGGSIGAGLTYQWQVSSNGSNYTDIQGANLPIYSATQSSTSYYRCKMICSGGSIVFSFPIMIPSVNCVLMGNGAQSVCDGSFYDSGGPTGNYANYENNTLTLTPSTPGSLLQVNFNSFLIENYYDNLIIYNGNSVNAPMLSAFSNSNPGSLTSTAPDGSLTFVFNSDFSINYSGWKADLSCVTTPINDSICNAISLPVDSLLYNFNNGGAAVQIGEQAIAPPATGLTTSTGWSDANLNNTVWFKFIAPSSGNVQVSCTDVTFDGQVAVYSVGNCNDLSTFALLGANDNALDQSSVSPEFTVCALTPGTEYYIMYDSRTSYSSGPFSIRLTPLYLEAGSFDTLLNVCYGDSVDLFDGIIGYDQGGEWYGQIPTSGLNGSVFQTQFLANTVFTFYYVVSNECTSDSTNAQASIYGAPSAGEAGTIEVCRNTPFNLLGGLSGNVDLGQTWYDPTNQPLTGDVVSGIDVPGNYNYTYIASNGVCPNDSAEVLVTVIECGAGIGENEGWNLDIFPNPTDGLVFLSLTEGMAELTYEILDNQGRVVLSVNDQLINTEKTLLDLSAEQPGMYCVRIFNDTVHKTYRIFKL